jgi:glycerol-3-phosphate acyltransferase PlsX
VSHPLTIALDVMGGDNGPVAAIEGANRALHKCEGLHYLLFGDEAVITPLLEKFPDVKQNSTLHHTVVQVASHDKPSQALRQGRSSSMRLAIDAVSDGRAHAVVSSGNTGALMAMGKVVLRMLEGIYRPAIIGIVPTMKGDVAFLDLGANVECDAETLFQFAIMGDAFARVVLQREKPLIGLLNVGSEDMKGHEEVKSAHQLLKGDATGLNYYGFVEGTDITSGTVDVIVTDGFTGNVALKTAEGTAKMLSKYFKQAFSASIFSKIGYLFAKAQIDKVRKSLDPRRHNGAMLIGLNGILVKSHGSADALAMSHAIQVAFILGKHNINAQIQDEIRKSGVIVLTEESAGSI